MSSGTAFSRVGSWLAQARKRVVAVVLDPAAASNWLLAAITILLVFVTGELAVITKDLIKVEGANLVREPQVTIAKDGSVELRNAGAYELQIDAWCYMWGSAPLDVTHPPSDLPFGLHSQHVAAHDALQLTTSNCATSGAHLRTADLPPRLVYVYYRWKLDPANTLPPAAVATPLASGYSLLYQLKAAEYEISDSDAVAVKLVQWGISAMTGTPTDVATVSKAKVRQSVASDEAAPLPLTPAKPGT